MQHGAEVRVPVFLAVAHGKIVVKVMSTFPGEKKIKVT